MRRVWIVLAVVCGAGAAGCSEQEEPARLAAAARAVSTSVCSPMTSGGVGRPSVLVPLVGPLQNLASDHGVQNAQAVKLVLQQRGWRAGRHTVGIQVCDESTADEPVDLAKCTRNARAFASNPSIVAVVGPTFSSCAAEMLPVLNAAAGGPVPLLGTGNTYLGLTRGGPGVQHDAARLYPTGQRNYLRTVAADDAQAAAAVIVARGRGARRPFVLHDGEPYGLGLAGAFGAAARRAGLAPAGTARWDPAAEGYRSLADRIRRTGADAVYVAGGVWNNGPRLIRDLRAGLGERVRLLAPDGFNQPTALVEGAGERADGLTITLAAAPVRALPEAGRRWAAEFRRLWGASPCCYAVHAGQVMSLVLDAIAGSDGSRAGVMRALRQAKVRDGLVGDFTFDRFGDSTLTTIAAFRIRGGRLRYETTLAVPNSLLTRR